MRKKNISKWLLYPYAKVSGYYNILIGNTFSRLRAERESGQSPAEARAETLPFLYCWYRNQDLNQSKKPVKMRPQIHN
ncbi:hypothetical protein NIASO_14775 [Niabella soli DSM 19437]|uniref:Uncharacterized protein n=1 Tax=Niabella soli DSM 19437 TaxID=929713 RepID=W0F7P0_9BACT|nr:hypothetical protein NIASO_14775 [Niabella soli DSM 19437]